MLGSMIKLFCCHLQFCSWENFINLIACSHLTFLFRCLQYREFPKDREYGREGSSTANFPSRSKSVCIFIVLLFLTLLYSRLLMQAEFMVVKMVFLKPAVAGQAVTLGENTFLCSCFQLILNSLPA